MSKKVANASKQPVAIRLVKRTGASVGFSDGIKPAGAVDDSLELSFNLGPYTPDNGRFVIGSASTPNIKNPQTYVDIGEEFKIVKDADKLVIEADLTTNETDPNYTSLMFGIFFRLKKADGLYVMASERPTHTVINYKNVPTQVEKVAIKQSVGQWFNDDHYYIPLYLGTVKELLAHWSPTTAMGLPELKALGDKVISNKVSLTVDLPLETVTITNTGDFVIGETVDITHAYTPAIAKITNVAYAVDDPAIADFIPGTNKLEIRSMGKVNVSVTLTDNIGNEMTTTKEFNTVLDFAPMVASYATNNSLVKFSIAFTDQADGFIDWGDGTIEQIKTSEPSHQYVGSGRRDVSVWILAPIHGVQLHPTTALTEIKQWGDVALPIALLQGNTELIKVPTTSPIGLVAAPSMFKGCTKFNQPLNGWNMSNVTTVASMFEDATSFNGLIDTWNMAKVTEFDRMFKGAISFNRNINPWNVSKGRTFTDMFKGASSYDQPISAWRVPVLVDDSVNFTGMFEDAVSFNQPVLGVIHAGVGRLERMFKGCVSFNQDLSSVQFAEDIILNSFLEGCINFNSQLGSLNNAKPTRVDAMLKGAVSFNQPIAGIDFSVVQTAESFLEGCSNFNQPLNDLDVSSLVNANYMLKGCSAFTSDLSEWDVHNLSSADGMFEGTTNFDSALNWWCVSKLASEPTNFATGSFLASSNYPLWGTCPVRNVTIDIAVKDTYLMMGDTGVMTYTSNKPFDETSVVWSSSNPDAISINASTGEYAVVGLGGATISVKVNDLYNASRSYVTIQEYTPALFTANGGTVTIQLANSSARNSEAYVSWGDDTFEQLTNASPLTHIYTDNEVRQISVMPMSPVGCAFAIDGDSISAVTQFGECDITITSATLTNVPAALPSTMTKLAFVNCPVLNDPNISNWNVSNFTDFSRMFAGCFAFNQPLSGWDVNNAVNMSYMFENTSDTEVMLFNQDISMWVVDNVTNMEGMFLGANNFNQPIGIWKVGKVTNMISMFQGAEAFAQDISWWCVTNITVKPTNFDLGSGLTAEQLPGWGACPSRTATLTVSGTQATMAVSSETQLTMTLRDGSSNVAITSSDWKVSDETKATITAGGLLTILAEGSFTVSATANRVYKANVEVSAVTPTVEISGSVTGEVGEVINLRYTPTPLYTPKSVVWVSDDETKATVSSTGVVTLLAVGEVAITVTLDDTYSDLHVIDVKPETIQFTGKTAGESLTLSVPKDAVFLTIDGVDVNPTTVTETHDQWVVPVTANQNVMIVAADSVSPLPSLVFGSGLGEVTTWSSLGHVVAEGDTTAPVVLGTDIVTVPNHLPANFTSLNQMFKGSVAFNDPNVLQWDLVNVKSLTEMFKDAVLFNQEIGEWNVTNAVNADGMFNGATAMSADLSWWCVSGISTAPTNFATGSGLTLETTPYWGTCPIRTATVTFSVPATVAIDDVIPLTYTLDPVFTAGKVEWSTTTPDVVSIDNAAKTATATGSGTASLSVTINNFITATNELEVLAPKAPFTAVTTGSSLAMMAPENTVKLFVDGVEIVPTGTGWSSYYTALSSEGMTVTVVPVTPSTPLGDFTFDNGISAVTNWGEGFKPNATIRFGTDLVGVPDHAPPGLKSLNSLFNGSPAFNDPNVVNWDMSGITNTGYMFYGAVAFNQPIGNWKFDSITNMDGMFYGTTAFNQDLTGWCVTNITATPSDFGTDSALVPANYPVWGTCPVPAPSRIMGFKFN